MDNPKNNKKNKGGQAGAFFKLLAKALVLLVPLLALVVYTNLTLDPAGLYQPPADSAEMQMVSSLESGYNITDLGTYNDRLIKREVINQMAQPYDTIVLGSSRGYLVSSDMLGEAAGSVFNFSVTGGCLEDFIGQMGLLHQAGLMPGRVVLALDPWAHNDDWPADIRSLSAFGDGYYYYLTEVMGYADVDQSIAEIGPAYVPGDKSEFDFWALDGETQRNVLSLSYFQAGLRRAARGEDSVAAEQPSFTKTALADNTNETIRADGSFSYPLEYRTADLETRQARAQTSVPGNIVGLEQYSHLGGERFSLLADFVGSLISAGIEVDILLLPMSSYLYEYMRQFSDYAIFFEIEDYNRANLRGATFYGTYNPYALDLTMEDFYDGYHPETEVYRSILLGGE